MLKFFDNSQNMAIIDDYIITDDEFKQFCNALGLSPGEYLSSLKQPMRNYTAVRRWCRAAHWPDDFVRVLVKMQHKALATRLGFGDEYAKMSNGDAAVVHTLDLLSVQQLGRIVQEVAMNWETIAARCGVHVDGIKARVHAGATPMDYSYALMHDLASRCLPTNTFLSALSKSGLQRVENIVVGMLTESPAANTPQSMSLGFTPPYAPTMIYDDEPRPTNKRSNPFLASAPTKTMRSFVEADGHHYRAICAALNETATWKELLKIYDLLHVDDEERSKEIAKLVVDLSKGWEKRQNNPSEVVLHMIAQTKVGTRTYAEFQADLGKINAPKVAAAVNEWVAFCAAETDKRAEKNEVAFTTSVTLRQVLLDNAICTDADVDTMLAQVTIESIGVASLDDLRELNVNDLTRAGWPLLKAKKCVRVLKEQK